MYIGEQLVQYVSSEPSLSSPLTTSGQCVPGSTTRSTTASSSKTSYVPVEPATTLVTSTSTKPTSKPITATSGTAPASTGIEYLISLYVTTISINPYLADSIKQRRQLLADRLRPDSQPCIFVQPTRQPVLPRLHHFWRPELDRLLRHAIQLQPSILLQLRKRWRNDRFKPRYAVYAHCALLC